EQRGEHERNPEQAGGGEFGRVTGKDEVEDDERRDDEQQHRRQRVACAQLEQQILARECSDVREVRHPSARCAVAKRSTRTGSWVATTNPARGRRSSSSRSSSAAPSSSSALCGSSSTSRSGSCSSTRQSARRCSMPREYAL